MKKKHLVITSILIAVSLIIGSVYCLYFLKPNCEEEKIILEGRLNIVQNKYPISVIETNERAYWMYGAPENFEENLNKRVKIEAILSPAYSQNVKCNICFKECESCQCPLDEELLYDIKILEIFE